MDERCVMSRIRIRPPVQIWRLVHQTQTRNIPSKRVRTMVCAFVFLPCNHSYSVPNWTITVFCIHNLKILIFTDGREYFRNPDNYCAPSKRMSTYNINDAKKECDSIPSCFMFFNYVVAHGKYFFVLWKYSIGIAYKRRLQSVPTVVG